jgi:hypothetical protein
LSDLKINISDQNEAIAILTNLPNLHFLNGKSTKEEGTGLDIEDRDIDQFSLNNEIENFNVKILFFKFKFFCNLGNIQQNK